MKKKDEILLLVILCLNSSIILFPSNLKFIPVVLLLLFSIKILVITKEFNYRSFLFCAIPYFILVIGMLFTKDFSYGLKKLETGAILFLYPFCFASLPKELIKKQIVSYGKYIFASFTLSVLIFAFSVFFYFYYFENRDIFYIIYHYNTLIDKSIHLKYQIHSIYLAFYVSIGAIFATSIIIKTPKTYFILFWLLIIFLILFLLAVMNKRMPIIALVIIGLIALAINLKKRKLKRAGLLVSFFLLFFLVFGIIFLPRFNNQNSFNEFFDFSATIKNPNTSIGKRVFIYKSAFKLVKENLLFGYGTGDSNHNLFLEMSKKSNSIKEKYNTHNQYLSYLLSTGIIGLLFFLYYLVCIFNLSVKYKDILFFSLLLLFTLNMLSENILEREAGALCFSFFSNLFFFSNKSRDY